MSKKQKPKKFEVFYFPDPNNLSVGRSEIILADNEADAETIFRINYQKELAGNELFFGWIEEIA